MVTLVVALMGTVETIVKLVMLLYILKIVLDIKTNFRLLRGKVIRRNVIFNHHVYNTF